MSPSLNDSEIVTEPGWRVLEIRRAQKEDDMVVAVFGPCCSHYCRNIVAIYNSSSQGIRRGGTISLQRQPIAVQQPQVGYCPYVRRHFLSSKEPSEGNC